MKINYKNPGAVFILLIILIVIFSIKIYSQSYNVGGVVLIRNGTGGYFTNYITSAAKNCQQRNSIYGSNNSFTVSPDVSSITTFVSD